MHQIEAQSISLEFTVYNIFEILRNKSVLLNFKFRFKHKLWIQS